MKGFLLELFFLYAFFYSFIYSQTHSLVSLISSQLPVVCVSSSMKKISGSNYLTEHLSSLFQRKHINVTIVLWEKFFLSP